MFGVAEVVRVGGLRRWRSGVWFLSLCGSGALILIGTFAVSMYRRLSFTLGATGCLMAGTATLWTLILPILAVTLLVLTLLGTREDATSSSA